MSSLQLQCLDGIVNISISLAEQMSPILKTHIKHNSVFKFGDTAQFQPQNMEPFQLDYETAYVKNIILAYKGLSPFNMICVNRYHYNCPKNRMSVPICFIMEYQQELLEYLRIDLAVKFNCARGHSTYIGKLFVDKYLHGVCEHLDEKYSNTLTLDGVYLVREVVIGYSVETLGHVIVAIECAHGDIEKAKSLILREFIYMSEPLALLDILIVKYQSTKK